MEKMNFKINVPEEVLVEKRRLVSELKSNQLVNQFLEEKNAPDKLIEDYPYRFKGWIEGLQRCSKCSGLSNCQQENRGQVYDLIYEGYLEYVLRPCRYAKAKKEEEAHLTHIVVNDMPSGMVSLSMDKLTVDGDNKKCIAAIMEWLENPTETGFYLHGPVGTGKTTLAAVACNFFARKQMKTAFVNVPSWVARMKLLIPEPEEIRREIRLLSKADFVVFDDIGAETVTSWARDELIFPILNTRMEEHKMTWFTSNEDWESLEAHFSMNNKFKEEKMKAVRILERIKTLSNVLHCSGKNRRNHSE